MEKRTFDNLSDNAKKVYKDNATVNELSTIAGSRSRGMGGGISEGTTFTVTGVCTKEEMRENKWVKVGTEEGIMLSTSALLGCTDAQARDIFKDGSDGREIKWAKDLDATKLEELIAKRFAKEVKNGDELMFDFLPDHVGAKAMVAAKRTMANGRKYYLIVTVD